VRFPVANAEGAGLSRFGSRTTVAMITMNEAEAVAKVIGDIRRALPDAEILLVDSSRDSTPEIARSLGARVIRQFPPCGYGPAMDLALRSNAREVVVTLDCDDTYPIEFIETMAGMVLEEGYDLVDGSRLARKPAAMPWLNFLANWGFALIASALFLRRLDDLHSGMRAYRRELIEGLRYERTGAALPVELLLRPLREGWKIKVVHVPYRPRIGKSTMRPLESAWWTVKRIWRSRFA
jgi:glycosyltransferase involved in cell wall biosynthesis